MASLIQLGDDVPTAMMKGFEKLVCLAYCPLSSKMQSSRDAVIFYSNKKGLEILQNYHPRKMLLNNIFYDLIINVKPGRNHTFLYRIMIVRQIMVGIGKMVNICLCRQRIRSRRKLFLKSCIASTKTNVKRNDVRATRGFEIVVVAIVPNYVRILTCVPFEERSPR